MSTQAKIKALREKQEEFKTQGDYGRAANCKVIADLLEEVEGDKLD